MSGGEKRKSQRFGLPNRASMTAIRDLHRLGINPIDEIWECLQFNKQKTLSGGNVDESGRSDQAQFAGLWLKAAVDLAKFKHPVLAAIAVKDLDSDQQNIAVPMTSREAIEVLKKDPFLPPDAIPTERVIEAMESEMLKDKPLNLPKGKKDE
jgi:hypothetical protein